MKVLYVGDVMGEPGLKVVENLLPSLKKELKLDVVIAQAENTTDGKGISSSDYKRLLTCGVDFFTGGNHSLDNPEIIKDLENPQSPIIRPANYPTGTPGLGYKYLTTPAGDILIISLLGQIVGRNSKKPVNNPLHSIDRILDEQKNHSKIATIVNFHGDYSSEKFVIAYYLDGKVSAVIGDHWHIPTADAEVLPLGTAHITDVGMCGSLDSSLGVKFSSILPRWRENISTRNQLEKTGRMQFNALLIDIDTATGSSKSVEQIRKIIA